MRPRYAWIGLISAVIVLAASVIVIVFAHDRPVPIELIEVATDIGPPTSSVPLGRRLEGVFLVAAGDGTRSSPYRVCVAAPGSPHAQCLFESRLAGAGTLRVGGWYRIEAIFDGAGPVPHGRVVTAEPAPPRAPGSPLAKPNRFAEQSEALSSWAARYGLSGYLRTDGVYVWMLPADSIASARSFSLLGSPRAAWREVG